jgi:hypothetical protein
MLEHTNDEHAPIDFPAPGREPGPDQAKGPDPARPTVDDRSPRTAQQALVGFGPILGWGLVLVGLLCGWSHAIAMVEHGPATLGGWTRAASEAAAIALAFALAGWASAVSCLVAAACIAARSERAARSAEDLIHLAGRAIDAVERLAEAMERRPIGIATAGPPDQERTRALAEIDEAARAERLDEAESMVGRFEARFPDDPAVPALRERLDADRQREAEGRIAHIEAARRVNDPERVLELYRALGSSLAFERRGEMERDLAKWFLELIHRRLRGGRIQPDVVQLAAQAAETFAATVEGASLRASLPVLRRSVGLCPRCGQPYLGPDSACPQCKPGAASAPAPAPAPPAPPADPEPAT